MYEMFPTAIPTNLELIVIRRWETSTTPGTNPNKKKIKAIHYLASYSIHNMYTMVNNF